MLALCTTAFVAFGVVLVLVGANQPDLASDLSLDLADTGLLGSALAGGIGIGVVVAGPLFDRYPRRPLFAGAMLLAAAALVTVDPGMSFGRWLAHLLLTGIGIGMYDTLINAVVVQRFEGRSARPMAAVHAGATLGAMLGPFFVAFLAARTHWSASFEWIGAAHLALAAWALFVPLPPPESRGEATASPGSTLSTALLPFAAIAFAYVGIEVAMTLFAVPYAEDGLGLVSGRGLSAISSFWLGLLLGRLAVVLLPRPDAGLLLLSGATGAVAIGAAAFAALPLIELPFFVVGLALGSVYPVMIALAGQRFPEARGTAAGLVAGAGAFGGFAVPWLTGALGDAMGVAVAFGSLALWSGLLALAAVAARD